MTWTQAIQYVETFESEADAHQALAFLETQVDFLAGRILPPTSVRPKWRTQAIFEGNGGDKPLPEGCDHVMWRGHF